MTRPNITRLTKSGGQFAKGTHAVAICHRSGLKKPYKEMVFEPGTNYFVHYTESDEDFSIVTHPQNYPPEKLTERIALRWAHFDVQLSVPAPVCINDMFWPTSAGYVSVGTATSVPASTGTGVSGVASVGLVFSDPANSQYYIVVFQGI